MSAAFIAPQNKVKNEALLLEHRLSCGHLPRGASSLLIAQMTVSIHPTKTAVLGN
ncbi:hypothetical protein [Roseateles sp.]|uniref:hypothetical protein n=1 Tax=Roseateles sp. TaxID=1971397 RepID=UPI003BA643AD